MSATMVCGKSGVSTCTVRRLDESRSSLAGLAARCVSFYQKSIYLSIYRWNLRLWRRLARAPEAVAGRPVAWALPGRVSSRGRAGALPKGHSVHAARRCTAAPLDS
eukprot:scaffold59158_cov45-Phaeocystis_antarctica.AAC.1